MAQGAKGADAMNPTQQRDRDTPGGSAIIRAAAVQFRSGDDLMGNCARIADYLARLAEDGVRVVAFPECAATAYDNDGIERAKPVDLVEAERRLSEACFASRIHAVVGMPFYEDGVRYNGALVWGPDGSCLARYAKMHLVGERWFQPGTRFVLFRVDGVLCSPVICFDVRFPEIVRLPVLAGARIIFYISCETDITDERRMDQYRAQIVARAVENTVWVVHANGPMGEVRVVDGKVHGFGRDSNGRSRIIAPDGVVVKEASVFQEEVVVADLDMARATGDLATRGLESPKFRAWWEEGLKLVEQP